MPREMNRTQRANICAAIIQGVPIRQIAKHYGVSQSTVTRINRELKDLGKQATGTDIRQAKFAEALEQFGIAALKMLEAQAELLSDPEYIKTRDTRDVIEHSRFIQNGLIKFIELQRGAPNGRHDPEEPIEAELVENPSLPAVAE